MTARFETPLTHLDQIEAVALDFAQANPAAAGFWALMGLALLVKICNDLFV